MNQLFAKNCRCSVLALTACLWISSHSETALAAPQDVQCDSVQARASPGNSASAAELQKNIQAGPLYKMLAAKSGRQATCRVRFQEAGEFELDYQFGSNTWLHVKRDARIEYTEIIARFRGGLHQPAETVLARVERASFGLAGCNIDWRENEIRAAEDDGTATETIFRGTVCNCQARIRRNARGQVEGLTLRSAC